LGAAVQIPLLVRTDITRNRAGGRGQGSAKFRAVDRAAGRSAAAGGLRRPA